MHGDHHLAQAIFKEVIILTYRVLEEVTLLTCVAYREVIVLTWPVLENTVRIPVTWQIHRKKKDQTKET